MNNKIAYPAIAVIIFIFAAFVGVQKYNKSTGLPAELSQWQAVFLESGEVYFGSLEKYNSRFYKLSNVYYLKYGSALQQDSKPAGNAPEQKLNLIKLGGELHGPENVMYIASAKVMFIENLKDSSSVVQAMKKTQ